MNQRHTDKIKLSLVPFDEVEKASDALWNLLLGILDRGTLTLGDNRRADFSASMIFLTSNPGAAEMGAVGSPQGAFRDGHEARMSRIGVAAARRRFTPGFIIDNRPDKIVVFKSLSETELERILDIELDMVQQRIRTAAQSEPFQLSVSDSARRWLLRGGTDSRYGARHLKRGIERLLV